MDRTLPGKSLDAQFHAIWRRFEGLSSTVDSIGSRSARLRRWLMPINVSFVIPIEDRIVCEHLAQMQKQLREHMAYAPQPADKLHITLLQIGFLRSELFRLMPGWSRGQLQQIGELARQYLALIWPFDVYIGPVNAFPNVAIAEVHDNGKLRLLSSVISQSISSYRVVLPPYPLIPHVTLGYFGRQPAAPIRDTIGPLRNLPLRPLTIERVDLTLYYPKPGPYALSEILLHSTEEVLAPLYLGR